MTTSITTTRSGALSLDLRAAQPAEIADDAEDNTPTLRGPLIAGAVTIGGFLGTFLIWAFLASLDSAAIAPGSVIVDSHRKTVQHLEGGILRELLVQEGQRVKAGQVLLRLDTTQADSAAMQLRNQRLATQVKIARLRAEQEEAAVIVLPPDLAKQASSPPLAEHFATQQSLLTARKQAYESQVAAIERRTQQSREDIAAFKAQYSSSAERLKYFEEEADAIRELVEKGYERKPRLLALQRSIAETRGRIGELDANMARARQAIAQAEFEAKTVRNQRQSDINRELQDAQAAEADFTDRLKGADDVLQRKDVVAPQDGQVVDLKFFTPGGVIQAGQPIMDIVPQDDDMIIEARVNPTDIDVVRVGLPAEVRMTAYRQRIVPLVDGEVIYVAADKMQDQRTGENYFTTRVRLKKESLAAAGKIEPYPGMPAEVYIVTGKRRAIDYFLSPIIDTARRSFREQ
ncbi:MAG: HlyD family type I secretion periplasmic adaptor subunit [Alphaproteobacteria bacterium]|nr:HlyD family type I secretion periplasmic adaptor subunit [Alphaproteobacteria bacterium]